jgi:hypothetical protein
MVSKGKKISKIEELIQILEKILSPIYIENPMSLQGINQFQSLTKRKIEALEDIIPRIKTFLKVSFPDGELKVKESIFSINFQNSVVEQAKHVRRYLIAYKEEIELLDDWVVPDKKLDKIQKEIKEKELEAKRRKAVADTKMYGGYIEALESLRKELRRKDQEIEVLKKKSDGVRKSSSTKESKKGMIIDQVKKVISPFIDQLNREIQIFESGGFGFYLTKNSYGIRGISELCRYDWQTNQSTINDIYLVSVGLKEKIEKHNEFVPKLKGKLKNLSDEILTPDFINLCKDKIKSFKENFALPSEHLTEPQLLVVTNVINNQPTFLSESVQTIYPQMKFWNEFRNEFLKIREKEGIREEFEKLSRFINKIEQIAEEIRDELQRMREEYRKDYFLTEEELRSEDLGYEF